jgi:hypothetical protein
MSCERFDLGAAHVTRGSGKRSVERNRVCSAGILQAGELGDASAVIEGRGLSLRETKSRKIASARQAHEILAPRGRLPFL